MFNFQNLNGLFNLNPETIAEISRAAAVATVPDPTPTPPKDFTFDNSLFNNQINNELANNVTFGGEPVSVQTELTPVVDPSPTTTFEPPAPVSSPISYDGLTFGGSDSDEFSDINENSLGNVAANPLTSSPASGNYGGGLSVVPSFEGYVKPDPDEFADDYIEMYDEWDRLSGQAGNSKEELQDVYRAYYKSEAALYDAMAEFDNGNISSEEYAQEQDNIFQEFKATLDASGVSTGYKDRYRLSFPLFNQQLYGEVLQGDVGFQKFASDNDSVGGQLLQVGVVAGLSIVAGPQIGAALGLTGAPAAAAGAAITSSASQLMMTGDLDVKQALVSAALAYGGVKLGEAMEAATQAGGVLADVGKKYDTFINTVSGGNSIAKAAIEAGGMSMLTQAVVNGEVNLQQAAFAAVLAGGAQAYSEFRAKMQEFDFASGENFDDTFEEIDAELEAQGLVEITPTGEYRDVPDSVQDTLDRAGKDYGGFEEPPENLGYYPPELDQMPPEGDELTYKDQGAYFDSEGNQVDSVSYSSEKGFIDKFTKEPVELRAENGIYDSEGNLYAYQKEGQWFRGDNTLIDNPIVVDELVNIAQKSGVAGEIQNLKAPEGLMDGSTEFSVQDYETSPEGNYIFEDISGAPKDIGPAQYSGTIKSMDADYDVYYNPETNNAYLVNKQDPTQVTQISQEQFEQLQNPSQTVSPVEGAMSDVETTVPGGGNITEDTGGTEGGAPEGSSNVTSGISGDSGFNGATGTTAQSAAEAAAAAAAAAAREGLQQDDGQDKQASSAILDANGEIKTDTGAESPVDDGGMLTGGSSNTPPETTTTDDEGMLTGGSSGATPTNEQDDQGGLTFGGASGGGGGGAGEGTSTGGGGTGGTAGSAEGVGGGGVGGEQGAGSGLESGTDGGTGGGEGEGTGGGEGDGSGGEGGTGGSGGGGIGGGGGGGTGGSGKFDPYMSGISYQSPRVTEIIQSPSVDYNAQLNAIINRNVGLFEGMI